jgi:hypothetical protein
MTFPSPVARLAIATRETLGYLLISMTIIVNLTSAKDKTLCRNGCGGGPPLYFLGSSTEEIDLPQYQYPSDFR